MAGSVGPARRGRRVQLQEPPVVVEATGDVLYVTTARPLKVGVLTLPEGVEVPGAGSWPRVESWVSARRLRKITSDQDHIPFEVFEAWINSNEDDLSLEDFHAQHEVEKIEAEQDEAEQTEE